MKEFAKTEKTSDWNKAEDAYRKARDYYEKSGVTDESMLQFIYNWQQYFGD